MRIIGVTSKQYHISYAAHIILLFNNIFCYLRLLSVFAASIVMGPVLFSAVAMLKDVLKFFMFFLMFILSFTWAFMGYVNESTTDGTWSQLYPFGPVLLPLWATFGEFQGNINAFDVLDGVGLALLFLLFILCSNFINKFTDCNDE